MEGRRAESEPGSELSAEIRRLAHILPAQGPIDIFVHHNTLHAFEDRPFDEALEEAARLFGTEPYWPEARYRAHLAAGRIPEEAVRHALGVHMGPDAEAELLAGLSRLDVALAIAHHGIVDRRGAALRWQLEELGALDAPGAADLWSACLQALAAVPPPPRRRPEPPVRHRDVLRDATGVDSDDLTHPVVVRFVSAFVDQGVALHPMAGRDAGLYACFARHYRTGFVRMVGAWGPALRALIDEDLAAERAPADSVAASLAALGVSSDERERFLRETALSLRGWAGLVCQLEARPGRTPVLPIAVRLEELLAVQLLVERATLPIALRDAGLPATPLDELRRRLADSAEPAPLTLEERAWRLFSVAGHLGVGAADLRRAAEGGPEGALAQLEAALCACDGAFVRRVLHDAFERTLRRRFLDAIAAHVPHPTPRAPSAQVVFCVDDREESFRRHLEDAAPTVETLGFAGFFGVPVYVLADPDARPRPRAPGAMEPRHFLQVERPGGASPAAPRHALPSSALLGLLRGRALHIGSRGLLRGALLTVVGALALAPLVARVLWPWRARSPAAPEAAGRLEVARREAAAPPAGEHHGFTVAEMADIVAGTLGALALDAARQAPLVALVGHTSGSVNNPHRSAYDCGACGGSPGGTNARAFAAMANRPEVRAELAARGRPVASGSWFVAAEHDTSADTVTWFDLEAVPASHRDALDALRRACDEASARNAAERCRRFDELPPLSPAEAWRHVRGRRMDLAQPRPEYNHATNAFCVVGRRSRTRGLFLDRRAFLVSYDPLADSDGSALIGLLGAVAPVVAGINLEYFFGTIDNQGYGSGTKLPHNVHGLVGVTSGAAGDLRTGLWAQTVEIHEPVRTTLIVEASPELVRSALAALPYLKRLVDNRWLFLAALDPTSQALTLVEPGASRPYVPTGTPPTIDTDWLSWVQSLGGHHGDLPFAVRPAAPDEVPS